MSRLAPLIRLAVLVGMFVPAFGTPASAQDIEVTADVMGRTLPAGYHALVREHPDFFEVRHGWSTRLEHAALSGASVEGTLPVLVVQFLFADSPEPDFGAEEIQQVLFDGPSEFGTITDVYTEMSGGRLTIEGHVTAWVRTSLTVQEVVGANYGIGVDSRIGEVLVEALEALEGVIDWGQFDNDGPDGIPNSGDDDGFLDAVAFQFYEVGASCGGPGPWPHRSRIRNWTAQPFETSATRPDGQPIYVDDYIIQSSSNCDGTDVMTSATIAHELGHIFGLPDLYHPVEGLLPGQRRWVIGCWSLMAGGSWGCGDPTVRGASLRPTHMGPWEKMQLGWVVVDTIGPVRNAEFVLEPVRRTGRVLMIPLSQTEHYLVEYREREGFDVELPAAGVLIYHVDRTKPFRPAAHAPRQYRVNLVEADGDRALVRTAAEGGDRGTAGDEFGNTALRSFSIATDPSARLNTGAITPVTFHSIAVQGDVARIRLTNEWITTERLVAGFLDRPGEGLDAEERELLDAFGNQNGRYDIGDLRRYIRSR